MALGMSKLIQKARTELNNLTSLEISSTVAAEKDGDDWMVTIEVIENTQFLTAWIYWPCMKPIWIQTEIC